MRLFISVDMEGTTGLERLEEIFRGLPGFDTFRQLMAGDCNAVIQGAIDGGATEIVVSNSHGYMCNMRPDDLVPGVQLRRGQLKRQWCQMKTLDVDFDAALMIGYHAKAGTENGILAHTWITGFRDVRVNGESVPEPSLNTLLAGSFGVPGGDAERRSISSSSRRNRCLVISNMPKPKRRPASSAAIICLLTKAGPS